MHGSKTGRRLFPCAAGALRSFIQKNSVDVADGLFGKQSWLPGLLAAAQLCSKLRL